MTEDKAIWSVPVNAIFPLVLTYYRQGERRTSLLTKTKTYRLPARLCVVRIFNI